MFQKDRHILSTLFIVNQVLQKSFVTLNTKERHCDQNFFWKGCKEFEQHKTEKWNKEINISHAQNQHKITSGISTKWTQNGTKASKPS